ncbi:MAG: glycosyltransferase family 4 protein [Tunicatimonas sp.]
MQKLCFGNDVLYVAPNLGWKGGISSVVMEYKKAIHPFQFQPSTSSEDIRVTVLSFPFIIAQFCYKLLVTHRQVKIVHIHGSSKGSFYRKYIFFLLARYAFRKKVVYHMHGAMFHVFHQNAPAFIQRRVRHFINTTDCLIVLSAWWKDHFLENFHPRMIRIVPNIVSATTQPPPATREPGPIRLLFLGRIGERKGVYDLLEVLRFHREVLQGKYVLKLGGDGETEKLQSLIKEYELEGSVKFIGFVTGPQKEQQLQAADVYLLPSHNEGLPISILEAMSFGLPVISTNVGGIPEVVVPHKTGLLIEAGDHTAIFEAIKFFINSPEKISEYGAHSYDLVAQHYFPAPVMDSLAEVYQTLLA